MSHPVIAPNEIGETPFHKNENPFNSDDVINAYLRGKQDGAEDMGKAIVNLLKRNIRDAGRVALALEAFLNGSNIPRLHSYIRITKGYKVTLLMVVSEDDFLNEKFMSVYGEAIRLEREFNDETCNISVSFMPKSEGFDQSAILSDGFVTDQR